MSTSIGTLTHTFLANRCFLTCRHGIWGALDSCTTKAPNLDKNLFCLKNSRKDRFSATLYKHISPHVDFLAIQSCSFMGRDLESRSTQGLSSHWVNSLSVFNVFRGQEKPAVFCSNWDFLARAKTLLFARLPMFSPKQSSHLSKHPTKVLDPTYQSNTRELRTCISYAIFTQYKHQCNGE